MDSVVGSLQGISALRADTIFESPQRVVQLHGTFHTAFI
jgi:hypothetical protein